MSRRLGEGEELEVTLRTGAAPESPLGLSLLFYSVLLFTRAGVVQLTEIWEH
jgi:hypothetical protein